jgi:hypothetical protein
MASDVLIEPGSDTFIQESVLGTKENDSGSVCHQNLEKV